MRARRRGEECRKRKSTRRPLKSQGDGIRGISRASEHKIRRVPPLGLFCLVIVRSVEMNYTCDPIKAPSASAGAERAQQVSTHAEGVIHLAEGGQWMMMARRERARWRASERAAILHSLVPPNEGSGLLLTTEQWKDGREEEGCGRWAWA